LNERDPVPIVSSGSRIADGNEALADKSRNGRSRCRRRIIEVGTKGTRTQKVGKVWGFTQASASNQTVS
jgi:hypothetical protein